MYIRVFQHRWSCWFSWPEHHQLLLKLQDQKYFRSISTVDKGYPLFCLQKDEVMFIAFFPPVLLQQFRGRVDLQLQCPCEPNDIPLPFAILRKTCHLREGWQRAKAVVVSLLPCQPSCTRRNWASLLKGYFSCHIHCTPGNSQHRLIMSCSGIT